MRGAAACLKSFSLIVIALASLGGGAIFLWGGLDRATLASAPLSLMLGVLALMLAPAPAIVAFEIDRRRRLHARRAPARISREEPRSAIHRDAGMLDHGAEDASLRTKRRAGRRERRRRPERRRHRSDEGSTTIGTRIRQRHSLVGSSHHARNSSS